MSRYQLIDTRTGEILWSRPTQSANGAIVRRAWQLEDKRRGYVPRRSYRQRSKHLQTAERFLALIMGAFLFVALLSL